MSEENISGREETKSSVSFIEQIIIDDLKEGKTEGEFIPGSLPNLMVISISVMQKPFVSISVWQRGIAANAIFVSMIQIR